MKIAILSDIHSNHIALKEVLCDIENMQVQHFCILGDIVGYYYNPSKVMELLNELSPLDMIQGNHEHLLKEAIDNKSRADEIKKKYGSGIDIAMKELDEKGIQQLISLPDEKPIILEGMKILLCHGSPFDNNCYIYPDTQISILKKCVIPGYDFIFMGHTHYPMIFTFGNTVIANPGSVGQPRDMGGLASYIILNTNNRVLTFRRVSFSVKRLSQMVMDIDPSITYLHEVLYRKCPRKAPKMHYNGLLVTGCGGDIAQGICRISKEENIFSRIVGTDINEDHPGNYIFDACETICRADDPEYFQFLRELIKHYGIEMIVPTSEAEIKNLLINNFNEYFDDIPVILPNKKAIQIGLDKLKTVNFLKKHNLDHPWTTIVKNGPPKEIPCILKMRFGQGSKKLALILDESMERYYQKRRPNDIWQELLVPEDQEYTCGLYRTKSGEVRTLVFHRILQDGFTKSGVVVDRQDIKDYLIKIANALELRGSINVQLKLTDRGPVSFEINTRFSSTVVFRHLLGFQDLIWSIKEKMGMDLEPFHGVKPGIRIYRGNREYIMDSLLK